MDAPVCNMIDVDVKKGFKSPSDDIRQSSGPTIQSATLPVEVASMGGLTPAADNKFQHHNLLGDTVEKLTSMFTQHEPFTADPAPAMAVNSNDTMNEFRMNGTEANIIDMDLSAIYKSVASKCDSESSSAGAWSEGSNLQPSEQLCAFDFLVKTVTAANYYLSLLTSEQLAMQQSIRPALLYQLLQDVAKMRREERMRSVLPNVRECAFCKNNGESEERYMSHSLKDFRGRVLCPVLRAFRCPRCNATGDRAHTIKYCPENIATDRATRSSRRRPLPSTLLARGADSASLNAAYNNNPLWLN